MSVQDMRARAVVRVVPMYKGDGGYVGYVLFRLPSPPSIGLLEICRAMLVVQRAGETQDHGLCLVTTYATNGRLIREYAHDIVEGVRRVTGYVIVCTDSVTDGVVAADPLPEQQSGIHRFSLTNQWGRLRTLLRSLIARR